MNDRSGKPGHPPVTDWATDFDHRDPVWNENPFPIWDELRGRCPVAHSERFQDGAYFPSRYAECARLPTIRSIFPRAGSSSARTRSPSLRRRRSPPTRPSTRPRSKLLLPAFAPQAIARLEPRARALCRELLDAIGDAKTCDAAVDYAQHIPVRLIAHMLGVPEQDGDLFRRWIHLVLEVGISDESVIMPTLQEMAAYFGAEIKKSGSHRGDDLISFLLDAKMEGQPLSQAHLQGTLRLLLIAGIDTTWSAIGASLWHLAAHAEDRRRLVADPALMPTAIEEFLRAYAPVTMAREVVKETTVGGCPFKEKGQVLLSFPAANRDPAKFPQADRVLIDRAENPHAAFGLGRHRCIGSNLARLEMTVAIEEWLARFPEFRLDDSKKVTWSEGTVRGPRRLPVTFN